MIVTQTPNSLRRPGSFQEFKFVAASQQLVPLAQRVVIVAECKGGTAAIEVPIQVFDEDDADTKAGVGSFGALMCKMAFATMNLKGAGPEIWLCPIAESGGVATQNTITVTGPATASGTLVLRVAGRLVNVGVTAGDAQNTIATAIKSALDALKKTLPVTAGVAANVVTTTNVTKGVNGNDVVLEQISPVAGVTIAFVQSVAGTLAASITNAVNALFDQRYHAVATSNHTTTDIGIELTSLADAWSNNQKNYRWFFMGERGSLGTAQALQAAANDKGIVVVSCEATPSLPGELAVAAAVATFARSAPNANLDGDELPLVPPSGAFAYTTAEIESALSSGVTPLTPSSVSRLKIERLVTTATTLNGAPFEPLRDIQFPRTAAFRAEQIDIAYRTGFIQETLDAEVKGRIRDMIIGVDRAMEALRYLRDVDTFLDQIQVDESTVVAGRVVASAPFKVAGPLHQAVVVNTMYF